MAALQNTIDVTVSSVQRHRCSLQELVKVRHLLDSEDEFLVCSNLKLQIYYSMNAPVMVELEGETDPLKIAMKEFKLVANLVYVFTPVLKCI